MMAVLAVVVRITILAIVLVVGQITIQAIVPATVIIVTNLVQVYQVKVQMIVMLPLKHL